MNRPSFNGNYTPEFASASRSASTSQPSQVLQVLPPLMQRREELSPWDEIQLKFQRLNVADNRVVRRVTLAPIADSCLFLCICMYCRLCGYEITGHCTCCRTCTRHRIVEVPPPPPPPPRNLKRRRQHKRRYSKLLARPEGETSTLTSSNSAKPETVTEVMCE